MPKTATKIHSFPIDISKFTVVQLREALRAKKSQENSLIRERREILAEIGKLNKKLHEINQQIYPHRKRDKTRQSPATDNSHTLSELIESFFLNHVNRGETRHLRLVHSWITTKTKYVSNAKDFVQCVRQAMVTSPNMINIGDNNWHMDVKYYDKIKAKQ